MNNNVPTYLEQLKEVYFLTQLLKVQVVLHGKNIGRLHDLIIVENGKLPEVSSLYVTRPFGYASLLIPFDRVRVMNAREVVVDLENLEKYEGEPSAGAVLLKDYILDKKVLDVEDREVEMVYDVKMNMQGGKLYISAVDLSKYGLLRRLHLKWLADLIYPGYKTSRQIIPWTYIQQLPSDLGRFQGDVKLNVLKETLAEMPPADVADILEELDHEQRVKIFSEMETERASDTLEEIDPSVQRALVSSLKKEKIAQLVNRMTPGQAADILSVLPMSEARNILKLLDRKDVKKIQSILDKQEEKILNFATQNFIKLTPDQIVGQVQDGYPALARGKDVIMYFYIVDENDKLLGVVDLKELLLADDNLRLQDIMVDNVVSLNFDSTLKKAYAKFLRYGFRAIPIIDAEDKILGVVPYRDVMNLKHKFIR